MNMTSQIKSNDNTKINPKTSYREPILKFDFPGVRIGIGEYEEGPTGCTVFHFKKRVKMVSDIRGGAPGVVGAHLNQVDTVTFAGGSLLGYEAITGVNAEVLQANDYKLDWESVPLGAGAIIWDFPGRTNTVYPDKALGRAALRSAKENVFPLGNQGAGKSATVGKFLDFSYHEPGGQGGAFAQFGEVKILVFTVVNALGSLYNRKGEIVRGHFNQKEGTRIDVSEAIKTWARYKDQTQKGNTTLTLAITNQKFPSRYEFQQVSRQIHVSMARAIQPFHHLDDGDVFLLASTEEVFDKQLTSGAFGVLAGELAWDAILTCFE